MTGGCFVVGVRRSRACGGAWLIVLLGLPLAAQNAAVPAPALTPAQIQASETLAAKYDESAAREKARLATFTSARKCSCRTVTAL